MKAIFSLFLALAACAAQAQTTHNVTIEGFTFSPSSVDIMVGDTVRWTNNTGTGHNVNGTTTTFPSNPESFGNSVGTSWVFTHVFTTAGEYDYQCNPHAIMGMTGKVAVSPVSSAREVEMEKASVFPNPASDFVVLEFSQDLAADFTLRVFDMAGREMTRRPLSGRSLRLETGNWPGGMYLFQITRGKSLLDAGQLIIQN